jgi:hypothetical protein
MNKEEFKGRTKSLGLRVIRLVEALPRRTTTGVIGKQLLRSATSVGGELSRSLSRQIGGRHDCQAADR